MNDGNYTAMPSATIIPRISLLQTFSSLSSGSTIPETPLEDLHNIPLHRYSESHSQLLHFEPRIISSATSKAASTYVSILKPLSIRLAESSESASRLTFSTSTHQSNSASASFASPNTDKPELTESSTIPESSERIHTGTSITPNFDANSTNNDPSPSTSSSACDSAIQTPKSLINSIFKAKKRKLEKQLSAETSKVARLKEKKASVTISWTEIILRKFQEIVKDFLPETLAKFTGIQAALYAHEGKGRRYSTEWKQFALHMYYLSPKTYEFLMSIFMLPLIRSLQHYTEKWECKPDFNDQMLEGLRMKALGIRDLDRHYSLCMDEMSLKAHLFHISRDRIVGLPIFDPEEILKTFETESW